MHDGRFDELMDVIQFYDGHIAHGSPNVDTVMHLFPASGNVLDQEERAQLHAFLLTLTDEGFLTNPAFQEP
jgi:cytochrome c peroxidase